MLAKYKAPPTLQLGYLEGKKMSPRLNIFQMSQHSVTYVGCYKIYTRNHGFSEISKIYQTLKSCISENSEYFFKIRKDPERSMSELSYEPNTIKNGHLAQKLGPMKDRRFSENSLSQPHIFTSPDNVCFPDARKCESTSLPNSFECTFSADFERR